MVIVFAFQKCSKRIENAATAVTRLESSSRMIALHLQRADSELHGILILSDVSGREYQSFLMTFGKCVLSPFLFLFFLPLVFLL